jgi:hypothetical protein
VRSVRSGWQESSRASWHSRICIRPSSAQSCGCFHAELPCYMPAPANGCASCNWFQLNRGKPEPTSGRGGRGHPSPSPGVLCKVPGRFRNLSLRLERDRGGVTTGSLNTGTMTSVAEHVHWHCQLPKAPGRPRARVRVGIIIGGPGRSRSAFQVELRWCAP